MTAHPAVEEQDMAATDGRDRVLARKRIEKRRNLQGGMSAFIVINGALVGIWAATGMGYFWPGWIIGLWGAGMVLGMWDYLRRPVTTTAVDRELERMKARGY